MKLPILNLCVARLVVVMGTQLILRDVAEFSKDSRGRSTSGGGKIRNKFSHTFSGMGQPHKGGEEHVSSAGAQVGPLNNAMLGWPAVKKVDSDPKIVVTLTTTPHRLDSLRLVLDSLIEQSYKPDEIHANIPVVSTRGLGHYPDLASLEPYKQHNLKIFRTEDWGPLTNILPTRQRLEAEKNSTLIIVADDDKVLPHTLVADHLRAHRKHPRAAFTCRGYKVEDTMAYFGEDTLLQDELSISIYGYRIAEEQRVGVVTGSDTWSVRADGFDDSLWTLLKDKGPTPWDRIAIGEVAMLMNDVWVSGLLSKANRSKYVMPCTQEVWDVPVWSKHADDSIGGTEVMPGNSPLPQKLKARDARNAVVMQYFKRLWKEEELIYY